MTGAAGVSFLRSRTVPRALRAYLRWIGRAVGWWTVVYLLFWLVVFVIAGFQSLPAPDRPLEVPLTQVLSVGSALLLLSALLASGSPPVILDRRDVYSLALSPARPWLSLRLGFTRSSLTLALLGLAVGATWSYVAHAWFGVTPLFAAPVLALLLVARLDLTWLCYAAVQGATGKRAAALLLPLAALLALAGLALPEAGLAAGLYLPSPLTLLPPLLLALAARLAVRASLARDYPPRFAAHSFVLAQLQALRGFEMLSRLSGAPSGTDPYERQRLLDLLRGRPQAVRPGRSLPMPKAGAAPWQAVAWRTASAIYRTPVRRILLLPLGLAAWAAAWLLLPGTAGVVAMSLLLAGLSAGLLGPASLPPTVPLSPTARTAGRVLPGVALVWLTAAAILLLANWTDLPPPAHELLLSLSLVPLVFLAVEKTSSWVGSASGGPEVSIAAAIIAATPAFLSAQLGVPGLAGPLQLLLVALLLLLPV